MSIWDNEACVERLKTLWAERISAAQVAARLGNEFHVFVSRSAVCAKVNRLGLEGGSKKRGGGHRRPTSAGSTPPVLRIVGDETSAPPVEPEPVEPEPEIAMRLDDGRLATTLTVNDRMCKWPIGDPAEPDFHFCGWTPKPGSPYCPGHSRKAFQPAPKRRDSNEKEKEAERNSGQRRWLFA